MNNVYEQVMAWTFIAVRVLIFGAIVWYAIFEYRRWSRKNTFEEDEKDEKDAEIENEAGKPAEYFELGPDPDRCFIRHGRSRLLFCGDGRNT